MRKRSFGSSKPRKSRQSATSSSPSTMEGDSLSLSMNDRTQRPSILWSGILRNDTLLVEADLGAAVMYEVDEAAKALLQKPPTPGWEHSTLGKKSVKAASMDSTADNGKLKGMKFHVYENFAEDEYDSNNQEDLGSEWGGRPEPTRKVQRRYKNDGLTIWTYACVYDPSLVDFVQVQSFLEKIVTVTEVFRQPTIKTADEQQQHQQRHEANPFSNSHQLSTMSSPQDVWRYGSQHAAQDAFAPVLLQRMEEVSYYGKLAMCNAKVDAVKEIMSRNIDLILENDERLAVMANEKAARLNEMAKVFAKNSKKVKRQMMWNNAKHGAVLGAAVTAGVAVVVVPPLVAIL
ncbi:MAG: hypothetical protein SGARI_003889 [Bacillariaceae sp.]